MASLTDEQCAVRDAAVRGVPRIVVEAGAGAGKTSTVVATAKAMPNRRGLITVFNKMMAEETKPRLAGTLCRASTLHSIAFASDVARPFRGRLGSMLPPREAAVAGGVRGPLMVIREAGEMTVRAIGYILKDWVARFCNSADEQITANHFPRSTLREFLPVDLAKKAEKEPTWFASLCRMYGSSLEPYAAKLWEKMSAAEGEFPSTHDVYLKLFVMSRPRLPWDYVMLDEAQDANPIMLEFMRLASEQGAQTVFVGDEHQQMYSWRGAVNALGMIEADRRLRLTNSFRFGPQVAEVANTVLGEMIGSDFRIVGAGRPSRVVPTMAMPSAVICRTNETAISLALEAREQGIRAGLCMNARELVREVETLERFKEHNVSDARRYSRFTNYDELLDVVNRGDAPDIKILLNLCGDHGFAGAKQILSDVAVGKTPGEIRNAQVQTMFLTAHASKGLEFPHVLVGPDFKAGEKLDAPGANRGEELNILYVTVTRAQEALCMGESEAASEVLAAMEKMLVRRGVTLTESDVSVGEAMAPASG